MSSSTHPAETNNGVVTSWLPVTSAWPSVPACSTAIYTQLGQVQGALAIAFDPFYGQNIDTDLSCLPPFATSWWDQKQQTPAQTVTSLGPIACPGLYTTASTSVLNSQSTFVACCPSNYQFQSTFGPGTVGQCNSALTIGQTFQFATFAEAWVETSAVITAAGASVYGVAVNGYIFAASTSSTTSSPAPTSSASSSTTTNPEAIVASTHLSSSQPTATLSSTLSTNSLTPESSAADSAGISHDSGLGQGAKIGIGIGVTLAIVGLFFIAGAVFFIRRRKQQVLTRGVDERELTLVASSKSMSWEDEHEIDTRGKHLSQMWELPSSI